MSETAYYHSELAAPWALVLPRDCPKFHFLASGRSWLEIDGARPRDRRGWWAGAKSITLDLYMVAPGAARR